MTITMVIVVVVVVVVTIIAVIIVCIYTYICTCSCNLHGMCIYRPECLRTYIHTYIHTDTNACVYTFIAYGPGVGTGCHSTLGVFGVC